MSFTFNKVTRHCRLHNIVYQSTSRGIASTGWSYYVYGSINCPLSGGFMHNRENQWCFKFSTTADLTYSTGKQYCENDGYVMASTDTHPKIDLIKTMITTMSQEYSIILGLTQTSGVWKWETGAIVTDSDWFPGEPDCGHAPICYCVYIQLSHNNQWNNRNCNKNTNVRSICEIL